MALGTACTDAKLELQKQSSITKASVTLANYCPRAPQDTQRFAFQQVFAFNRAFTAPAEELELDTDADGVSDQNEKRLASTSQITQLNWNQPDSNNDGYSDLIDVVARLFGLNLLQVPRCMNIGQDTDLDLLTDCEEDLLATSQDNFDTDLDGVPDGLEVRWGLNPLERYDANLDPDGDSLPSVEELRAGTSPVVFNTKNMNDRRVVYQTQYAPDVAPGTVDPTACGDLSIRNISLAQELSFDLIEVLVVETATQRDPQNPNLSLIRMRRLQIEFSTTGATLAYTLDSSKALAKVGFLNKARLALGRVEILP